jgi:hypothetical protein
MMTKKAISCSKSIGEKKPVERYKKAQRTYFSKNMLTYHEANRHQRHVHDLRLKKFRVLTVTTTSERVERMLTVLDGITDERGSNMFLFTHVGELAASNPLDLQWTSGKREAVRLTDRRHSARRFGWLIGSQSLAQ